MTQLAQHNRSELTPLRGQVDALLSLVARGGADDPQAKIVLAAHAGGPWRCFAHSLSDLDAAERTVRKLDRRRQNVYVHMCVGDQEPRPGSRLTAASAYGAGLLWADIDYGSDSHRGAGYPRTQEEALEIIEDFPLAPSLIVASGYGLHTYWARSEAGVFGSDDERKRFAELLGSFGAGLQAHLQTYGYRCDSVWDLARVLRVPGSHNWKKSDDPVPVEVLRRSSAEYRDDEFRSVCRPRRVLRLRPDQTQGGVASTGQFDRILDGCAFMRHVRDDAEHLPEPEWHVAATVAASCSDGRAAFHTLSEPYPDYSPQETDDKFERAAAMSPYGCAKIHEQHFQGCDACPFLAATGSPADLGQPWDGGSAIYADAPLTEAAPQAWRALHQREWPPTIFSNGSTPVLARRREDGALGMAPLQRDDLRHRLVRSATFLRIGKGGEEKEVPPSDSLLRDLMAYARPPYPPLRGVAATPIVRADGTTTTSSGYDRASGVFVEARGLEVPPIPSQPSGKELRRARNLLLTELLGDFDFVADADRAHALAALLLPFARAVTPGATPLHLISKPVHGSGGTLLARALLLPAAGPDVGVMTEAENDGEWSKRITAAALAQQSTVLIDNLRQSLDSGSLAAALTSPRWRGRVLGSSTVVDLEFAPLWMATGNNPKLSGEISRRSVQIRIDPRVDRPWLRDHFRHPNLLEWARDNRGDLVWAALVLWRNWVALGRQDWRGRPLGSYERWSRVLGGVLESANVPGFLGNLDDLYEAADDTGQAERALVGAWFEEHGSSPVTASSLLPLLDGVDYEIPLVLNGRDDRARAMELGRRIAGLKDRRFDVVLEHGPVTLMVAKATMRSGTSRWQVVRQ